MTTTTTKGITVLVADKDGSTRQTIRDTVLSVYKKAQILEAPDGTNAEYKVANQPFDLVILAQKIPGKDGNRVLQSFQALDPKVKPKCVILFTESKDPDESLRAIYKPLFFLPKPCEADILKDLLAKLTKIFPNA